MVKNNFNPRPNTSNPGPILEVDDGTFIIDKEFTYIKMRDKINELEKIEEKEGFKWNIKKFTKEDSFDVETIDDLRRNNSGLISINNNDIIFWDNYVYILN